MQNYNTKDLNAQHKNFTFFKKIDNVVFKVIKLNSPYYIARIQGYKYYVKVNVSIAPTSATPTPSNVQYSMKKMGATVKIVRWAKRRNYRSMGFWHFAVFKDIDSALLFKLSEDGSELRKFEKFWNPLELK